MKKKLLTLASLTILVSGAFSQNNDVYVTGTPQVKVSNGTMFYVGGNLNVQNGATGVVNDGNIYIPNGYLNNSLGTKDTFKLTYTKGSGGNGGYNDATYGQLITKDSGTANSGRITVQAMMRQTSGSTQAGFPFSDYTLDDWKTQHNIGAYNMCPVGQRCTFYGQQPIYKWSNENLRWDPVPAGQLEPGGYYSISSRRVPGYAGVVRDFIGTPNSASKTVRFANTSSVNFGAGGGNSDVYVVRYNRFIDDYGKNDGDITINQSDFNNPSFGRYQLQLSNPYPSNIDLSYIGIDEPGTPDDNNNLPISAIWKYTTTRPTGTNMGGAISSVTVPIYANLNGEFSSGATDDLIVRPFESFIIKGRSSIVGQDFNFNDGLKTFKSISKNQEYGATGGNAGTTYTKLSDNSDKTYQVGFDLYDSIDKTGNRTFIAVNKSFKDGQANDPRDTWTAGVGGLYGLPEDLEGGINKDQAATAKFNVNLISDKFINKAIPLGFKANTSYSGNYTIKAKLFDNGRVLTQKQFSESNVNFVFHDKLTGIKKEITSDFSYEFEQASDTSERFEVFYGSIGNLGTDDNNGTKESLAEMTKVYKNYSNDNYYVRFAPELKKALIQIHTLTGQLVSFQDNIEVIAGEDYLLNINSGSYIVSIQDKDSGKIVSSKVIK